MSLLGLGCILALAAGWLTLRNRRVAGPAPIMLWLVVFGAPALFVMMTWLGVSAEDAARLRFSLLGVGHRGEAGEELSVSMGGDRERHEVWLAPFDDGRGEAIRGKTEGAARAQRLQLGRLSHLPGQGQTADGLPAPLLRLETTPGAPGVFATRSEAGYLRPVGAVQLQHGDALWTGEREWRVLLSTGLFGPPAAFESTTGERVDLPHRVGRLPFLGLEYPILRAASSVSTTYPVAWLDRVVDGEFTEPRRAGFLFHEPSTFGGRLWLLSGDPEVRLERQGAAVERSVQVDLRQDQGVHAVSPPRWAEDEFVAGGIRDRRSFRAVTGERSLALIYDTPEVYTLPWSALRELAVGAGPAAPAEDDSAPEALRLHLSMGGWQLTDRSLYLRHTSLAVGLESLAILELPGQVANVGEQTFSVATPRGQRTGTFGQPLWLGASNLAAVQIDVLSPPVWLAGFALLLALFKIYAARVARLTMGHALFAAGLETLVALRLLLGYEAWAMPPFEEEAYRLALVAWIALPWLYLVAALPIPRYEEELRRTLPPLLPAVGGWLLSLGFCLSLDGERAVVWLLVHLLALALPLVRWLRWTDRAVVRLEEWLERDRSRRREQALWWAIAVAPGVLRIVALLLGFRESLQLGQRFALSLIHVPMALVLQAVYLLWLWRRTTRRGSLAAWDLTPILAFVLGTWLLPAIAVSDLGLALLNVPIFLLASSCVVLALGQRLADRPLFGWRYWLVPAALALTLTFIALPAGARFAISMMPDSLAERLESERNFLRLLDFAYPQRLGEVARRHSEELAVMSAVLRVYTSVDFTGRGYLDTQISPHIQATALREHVPAVYIAAQWGAAGVIGMCLALLLAAGAGLSLLPGRLNDDALAEPARHSGPLLATIAALAATTLAVPGLYMSLANYRLALFTGKNAYLLGLDSTADVLEAAVLVMMFAVGMAAYRDQQEASQW